MPLGIQGSRPRTTAFAVLFVFLLVALSGFAGIAAPVEARHAITHVSNSAFSNPDPLANAMASVEGGFGPAAGTPWSCEQADQGSNAARCDGSMSTPTRSLGWNGTPGPYSYSIRGGGGMVDDFADHYVLLFDNGQTWTFTNSSWTYHIEPTSPAATCGFGIAYDANDQYVVLFGGNVGSINDFLTCTRDTNNNQTWIFKAGVWTRLSPLNSPPPEVAAPMAYDVADRGVVLLDSQYAGTASCDTWEFARGNWNNVCPATSPGPRAYAAMKYDPSIGGLILFGGLGCPTPSCTTNTYLNETWQFKSGNWTQLNPTASPPPQRSMVSVYDGFDNYLIILGGDDKYVRGGTGIGWLFANGTWTKFTAAVPWTSYLNAYGDLCFDASLHEVLYVLGGRLWTYQSGTWSATVLNLPTPTLQFPAILTYDWADGYTLAVWEGTTWSFDGVHWTDLTFTVPVTPSGAQAMTYDSRDGYVLLYADATINRTTQSRTWSYLHGAWTPLNSSPAPSPRMSPGMVYDDSDGYVILLGGSCGQGLCGDMWNFSRGNWTNISSTLNASMPARYGPDMANDSAHHDVLLFGGRGAVKQLSDTWTYSKGKWAAVPNAKPPAVSEAQLVPDPAFGAPLLIGTTPTSYNSYVSVWSLSNGVWKTLTTSSTSVPEWSPMISYDGASGLVTLTTTNLGWSFGFHSYYSVLVKQSGLRAGTAWSVRALSFSLNVIASGSGPSLSAGLPNGTYFVRASAPAGYVALPGEVSFTVQGGNTTIGFTFAPLYKVSFHEYGLGSGMSWRAELDGFTLVGNGTNIVFYAANGSHDYFVATAGGLSPTPASGILKVAGGAVVRPVKFA